MAKRLATVGWAVCAVLAAAAPVWAEDPGMKAEIELLKSRLAKLEAQQVAAAAGAEPGNAIIELPSGLHGVKMSGFVDTTATYNMNEPETNTNTLRVFDTRSNGFLINNAQLTIEKPVSTESPMGFKTELMFGTDAEVVGGVTGGLGANAHTHGQSGETAVSDEVELQEAYAEYLAPLGNGLDVRIGKFATLHGAEVIEAKDNWNISRSFLFGYAIPFTHTGGRATYAWNDKLSTTVGVSNGWDLVDDTNKAKTVEFNVTATPLDGVSLCSTYMFGAEQAGDNTNQRHLLDLVLGWQPIEPLQLKLNYDYADEDDGGGSADNAVWHGLAAYARYALTEKAAIAGRMEYLNDADGVRTAFTSGINGVTDDDIRLYEFTLTGEYKLTDHLLTRLEYRHDTANAEVFVSDEAASGLGKRSYQDTVALQFIALF